MTVGQTGDSALEHGMLWMADYPTEGRRRFPDRPAIIDPETTFSYQALDEASDRFVGYLTGRGITAGHRVAYLGKNNALFFPVLFGCLRAGVILVPLNWRYAPGEVAFVLGDAAPDLLLFDTEFEATVQSALATSGVACATLAVSGPAESLRTVLADAGIAPGGRAGRPDDCAMLMYTSGTTGKPKGTMLSHRALSLSRWVEIGSSYWTDWADDEILLSAMPNFHIGGLSWMLIGLLRSLTCVQTADPSPANLLGLSRDYHVTRTFMVPTVVRSFVELAAETGVPSSLRSIYYGAAFMDSALLARAMQVLNCRFNQYFGMTENCGTATFLPAVFHDPENPVLLRSVGRPLKGMELTIRAPDGATCEPGQSGEIWIKAPTLMLGYWNRPDATDEAMVDGWYRTGDGGYLDVDGFLYLTDRLKDIVITGGENVYPVEVEEMLRHHAAIKDVVVVGTPDPVWGEAVTAIVEWKDGQSATLEELRQFGRSRLAGYKLPRVLHAVALLPRTATGKLQRAAARKLVIAPASA